VQDALDENNETVIVDITNVINGAENGVQQQTTTITDDDPPPSVTLAVDNANIAEAAGVATFTATLSAISGLPVTVDLGFGGTATFTSDYTRSGVQIVIPAGNLTGTITVTAVQDALDENNETVIVDITNVANGTESGVQQQTTTITDDDPPPTLTVTGGSVPEGNVPADNRQVAFTLALSAVSGLDIAGTLATTGISTTEGGDFDSLDGMPFLIPAGTQQIVINVPVIEDTDVETDETLMLTASVTDTTRVSNAGGTAQGTGTIQNDDFTVPSFSINDISVNEGNAGTTSVTFMVSLSQHPSSAVTVTVTTANDSATLADGDYQSLTTVLTFNPGEALTQPVTVLVNGDLKFEPDETFFVNLANPTGGAQLGKIKGLGTIVNDDNQPTISLVPLAPASEGNSGFVDRLVTVQLSNPSFQPIPIEIVALNLTSVAPIDYTFTNPTALTFSPGGPLSQTVAVRINGDTLFERDEQFRLLLQNPQNATIGATGQIDIGILNDDAAPTLTVTGGSVEEGHVTADNRVVSFTLALSAISGVDVAGTVSLASGTAQLGVDFENPASLAFTIPAGTQQITINVPVIEEITFESEESFTLTATVTDPTTITAAGSILNATGTIQNDDVRPMVSLIPIDPVPEGNSGFVERLVEVRLSHASFEPIPIEIVALNLTSVAPIDYTFPGPTSLTFNPGGAFTQTVAVRINGDTLFERDEQFRLMLQLPDPPKALLGTDHIDITIQNDDAAPALTVTGGSVLEGHVAADDRRVPFTLALSAISGVDVAGTLSTASGTAVEGTDFDSLDGTPFLIPSGTLEIIVQVPVLEDTDIELDETLLLTATVTDTTTVSNVGGTATGLGTILNDDFACGFVVTTTADSGTGSLREAINCANTTANIDRGGTSAADPDPITFAIPTTDAGFVDANNDDIRDPGDYWSILPRTALPTITEPVLIDGYTQSGASRNSLANANNAVLLIELNGASAGASVVGLTISAGTSTVSGLVINRFSLQGIRLLTSGSNLVEGNFIGTDVAGTADLGNAGSGVLIDTANNEIGGTTPGARNIISGNNSNGVSISGSAATGNLVRGNFIGTDASGTLDRGNNVSGVFIDGAPQNVIGGVTSDARNVISGNNQFGVNIAGSGATGNLIQGNFLGTDVSGTLDLGNTFDGMRLNGAPGNTIGGTVPGARNVISGHAQVGIQLTSTTGNVIQGNFIGTDVTGSIDIGNSRDGIALSVSSGNTIGGTAAGAGNLISGNDFSGVKISSGNNNLVQGNLIGTNATGTAALGNGRDGVEVGSNGLTTSNNTIGGTIPGARNTISGNGRNGVQLVGGGSFTNTSNNLVQGNFIGTDVTGTADLGNSFDGVSITGASNNTVGGITLEARNIISGNNRHGVALFTGTINNATRIASGNLIQGNFIGTDVSGTLAMANVANGVHVEDALNNTIGGTVAGARNVISGNGADGISLLNSGTTGTLVQGNFIGTQVDGISALGNSVHGVFVSNASNNTIGGIGVTPGACDGPCNVIAFNSAGSAAEGVHIQSGTGNAILGNAIFANGELGIDLGADDIVTLNDVDDADTGANNLHNFPILESASIAGGNLTLTGFARPGVAIELFIAAADPTGFGEGRTFLARLTEGSAADLDGTTGAYGPGPVNGLNQGSDTTNRFRFVLPLASLPGVAVGTSLTSTATDANGNTSEFSGLVATVSPAPTLSINDVTQNEGNSGTTAFEFTVSLSQAPSASVNVTVATADDSATTADSDYAAVNQVLTFTPTGPLTQVVTVNVVGDTKFEQNQTFFVNLSNATAGTAIGDSQGIGTIGNDDSRPTISILGASAEEGNMLTFTLSLSNLSDEQVTVLASTADGTATVADNDYTAIVSQLVTFAPGANSASVIVQSLEDTKFEADQTFAVVLAGPVSADGVSGSPATGTIQNDDSRPTISINDRSVLETNSSFFDVFFDVTLSNPSDEIVTVRVDTANGTATTSDNDYVVVTDRTVTFSPGITLQQTPVQINGDTKFESDQTFFVNLSNAANAQSIADSQGPGTIQNDDSRPTITIAPASASEGDLLTFNLSLSNLSDEQITVLASTADGTATIADNDYTAVTNQLVTFAPGAGAAAVTVQSLEDNKFETDQTFTLVLAGAVNTSGVAGSPALGTILNDDARPTIRINDRSVPETNSSFFDVFFDVTLSHPTDETVTVRVDTADGTATTADSDYVSVTNRTVTFNPGVTLQQTPVRINGDALVEPDETFFVNLSGATNASSIADNQGLGTILNDDSPCSLIVTTTADSGAGSLREAIICANTTPGLNTVSFNIAGGGVKTISPASTLPTITDAVQIDGTSQPTFAGTPIIEIRGDSAGPSNGLTITAANSTIKGLVINRFGGSGILVTGTIATGNQIQGNYIGTDPTGNSSLGNNIGVSIVAGARNNIIGTNGDGSGDATEGNVISGHNSGDGIRISGSGTDSNVIAGNLIGTNAAGTAAIGNFGGGNIEVISGAAFTRIGTNADGTSDALERNVVSGSQNQGIVIRAANDTIVAGNYIGTDVTGSVAIPNAQNFGISVGQKRRGAECYLWRCIRGHWSWRSWHCKYGHCGQLHRHERGRNYRPCQRTKWH
jgi:Calx-beta domain